jgi:hypothetical protein
MPRVDISDPARYDLAAVVAVPLGASADADKLSVTASEPLATFVRCIATGESAVLPVRRDDHDD